MSESNSPVAESELYDEAYYKRGCGPIPYDRSVAHWGEFFGKIADELIRTFRMRRVFDAGCAKGFLVEALWERGVTAFGRDVSRYAISEIRADVRKFCSVGSLTEAIKDSYDLITCIEVLEHMPEDEALIAIANMTSAADIVVFSSSPSDFDEPTHVNVRPTIYWMRAFAKHGFVPLIETTLYSITPYALAFQRRDEAPTDDYLCACAEVVRFRIKQGEEATRIHELCVALNERTAEVARNREAAERALAELREQSARGEQEVVRNWRAAERELTNLKAQCERAEQDRVATEAALAAVTAERDAMVSGMRRQIDVNVHYLELVNQIQYSRSWRAYRKILRILHRFHLAQGSGELVGRLLGIAQEGRLLGFDREFYLAQYPDVAHLGIDPLRHYLDHGRAEGRAPTPAFLGEVHDEPKSSTDLSLGDLCDLSHDDTGSRITDEAFRLSVPAPEYKLETPASDPELISGKTTVTENPTFRDLFDAKWYLQTNKDVAAAGIDPLEHYIAFGEAEGRDPNPAFSARLYREAYMQGEPATASPLRYYVEYGHSLGHDANPSSAVLYQRLIEAQEQSYSLELGELTRHIGLMNLQPLIVVYLTGDDPAEKNRVQRLLGSQIYKRWTLCTDRRQIEKEIAGVPAEDWGLVWLETGDSLHSSALYAYASRLNERPCVDVIYADEDEMDERGGRRRPFVKPDWSPDYFESFNFIGSGAFVAGRTALAALREARNAYDFLLRVTENGAQHEHIRRVLVHRSASLDSPPPAGRVAEDIAALQGHLERTGRKGVVSQLKPEMACYDVRVQLSGAPLVSIIIPTAGKIVDIDGRKVDLLRNCLDHVASVSTYKNIEIIVIHNCDLDESRLSELSARGVRLVAYQGDFNVARKLNLGVAESRGELLLLLNDDIEPLTPDWLERMIEQFEKPWVGVVGAKLLFPSMLIQHAGVVMVKAKPDHLRFKYPRDDSGYFFSTCAVRDVSAVTGAVMMTRATLYKEIGGYTEELPINFNDVDYCLKASRAGYVTVYTPRAELIHYESMSRVREVKQFEVSFFEDQWRGFVTDPYYNEASLKTLPPNYEVVGSRAPIG
ncbi:glycosyltransferase [Paraburkholderia sp. J8-2]|uniref:glycosyltransferase n=1 Tax=Paraburkholderia sp. J8-2 TaxID=2805440 RepID=UPI002AB6F577|nr:glycosyltransferase [Paraburkholderia sp. J8-2]